jgi:hypothetical protein
MHDGSRRLRRRRGERPDVEKPIHRAVRVMLWGAIGYGSRSLLVFIWGICALHKRSSGTVFDALSKWSLSANISAR